MPHEISIIVSMPIEWQAGAVLAGEGVALATSTANPTVPGFSSNPILGEVERAAIREIVRRVFDAIIPWVNEVLGVVAPRSHHGP